MIKLIFLLLSSASTANAEGLDYWAASLIKKQVVKHNKRVNATAMSFDIIRIAKRYNLDPLLYSAIIAAESGYRVGAINKKSMDYGIAQVSEANIKAKGWDKKRILTDVAYSLDKGAQILAYFQRRYKSKEPTTWFCRYNVGTRKLIGKWKRICLRYASKVWERL